MIRNLGSRRLNHDKIGYRIEREIGPIRFGEAQAYANAIKDRSPCLSSSTGLVTPFFPSKLFCSMAKEMIALKGLKLNLLKMVHGEQDVVWHHPVKVGDRLKLILAIESIQDTLAGDLLTLLGTGFRCDEVMFEIRMGFLVRRKSKLIKKKPVKKNDKELFRLPLQTDDGQQMLYAKASGDDNFIHTSPFLAKMAGLPRTIMQGVCVLAMTCSTISKELIDQDLTRLVSIKGRFANVVLPGQRLMIVGYAGDNPFEVSYEVINPSTKPVIKNGIFKYRPD